MPYEICRSLIPDLYSNIFGILHLVWIGSLIFKFTFNLSCLDQIIVIHVFIGIFRMKMCNLMMKVTRVITLGKRGMKMFKVMILEKKMMGGMQGCYRQLLVCPVRLLKVRKLLLAFRVTCYLFMLELRGMLSIFFSKS